MNFLKKLKQPLTGSSSTTRGNHHNKQNSDRDLEDDLYDEYVVEAPPHPSELLALGVDPNDPNINSSNLDEKLKELYSKSKLEAGSGPNNNNNSNKTLACNSVLLAKQRQKEEIEEKKKTREEWKYFDSLTARVQQAVDSTKKTLDHLKESSAIDEINQPDYELKLTPDEIFKSSATVKQEKEGAENWVDFGDSERKQQQDTEQVLDNNNNTNFNQDTCKAKQKIEGSLKEKEEVVDPFGVDPTSHSSRAVPLFDILCETSEPIVPILAKSTDTSGPDPFDTSFVKF